MRRKLVLLAFLLAATVGAAGARAAETECYYCECNGGRCICVEVPCG